MAGPAKTFSEINITPLTDIFLVLLIIMMVVAPMMNQSNQAITIPQVQGGSSVDPGRLTVEITADGAYYVGGQPVPADQLATTIKTESQNYTEKNLVIRADKKTQSKAVLTAMDAARDAELPKVTIAGEPLSDQRAQTLQQAPSSEDAESSPAIQPLSVPEG